MKIIIQQTEDGLKVVYPPKYDRYSEANKPYQYFLKDEAHIADYADAFSVQMANGKKVYSLISSDIKDYLSRAGSFFAIRIFLNENEKIEQVFNLLKEIKTRYVDHYVNKKMAALSFDDLIANNKPTRTTNKGGETIAIGFKKNAYAFIENTNLTASTFEKKAVKAVQCIYLFNKEKTSEGVYIRMQPLDKLENIREVAIAPNNLLQGLKVNDALVENYPKNNEFKLLVTENAKVSYQQKGKDFKHLSENPLILRNYTAPKSPPRPPGQRTPKKDKIITYSLLGICFAFLIGGILFFLVPSTTEPVITTIPDPGPPTGIVNGDGKETEIKDKSKITEEKEESETKKVVFTKNTDNEYKISTPQGLEHYSFKYAGGKWSFKNSKGSKKYVDFYTENFKDIISREEIDTKETDFIQELEALSGKSIKDKPKPKPKVKPKAKPVPEKPKDEKEKEKEVTNEEDEMGGKLD